MASGTGRSVGPARTGSYYLLLFLHKAPPGLSTHKAICSRCIQQRCCSGWLTRLPSRSKPLPTWQIKAGRFILAEQCGRTGSKVPCGSEGGLHQPHIRGQQLSWQQAACTGMQDPVCIKLLNCVCMQA